MTIMTYNNDDPFSNVPSKYYYHNFMSILPMADINFIYRKKNIADYHSIGDKNPILLLPYYLKQDNFVEDIEKDIPVAFIGHYEVDGRDAYINALVEAGLPICLFNGSDWDKAPLYGRFKSIIRPAVRVREYNHTLNRCQIALVFLSKINSDTYTRRCFEIPATRTLMLSEYTDDLNEMFPDGECAVYFRSPEELVQKCQWLLTNPDEIIRIAENGYQRVKQLGGSETDRCQQIIDCYQQLK